MPIQNPFVRAFAVLMPFLMFTDIILTGTHYFLDAFAGTLVMLVGLGIALGGRWFAIRFVSPESKEAREKGWVSWMYWLCGVAYEPRDPRRQQRMQTA